MDKINEILPILDDIHNIRLQQKQQRYQEVAFILNLNQALTPENIFQSNEKIVNQIYLETIGMDNYDFSDHQQKIINSIADQCESVGGKAVLTARALQQFYLIKYYDLEHGCGDYSNARIGKTEKQKIQIYPNPSIGEFSIQFEYPTEENLDLEFYDMNGRLLFQDKLFRGEFSYSFNNLNLESGIYICKLKSAIGNVLTQKIVINKF